jgi:hypothetical protein
MAAAAAIAAVAAPDVVPGPPAAVADNLRALLAALDLRDPADFPPLLAAPGGPALLARGVAALGLPLGQEAALLLAVGSLAPRITADPAPSSADHLAVSWLRQEEERRYPWRVTWALADDAAQVLKRSSIAELQGLFAESAKTTGVPALQAAWLQSLLFFTPDEQRIIAGALLKFGPGEALQIFNLIAAQRTPAGAEQFVRERGHVVVSLATPLWPGETPFAALRLAQLSGAPSGGGTVKSDGKRHEGRGFGGQPFLGGGAGFGGVTAGGTVPVGRTTNGDLVADTTALEAWIEQGAEAQKASLQRQVAALERKVIQLGGTLQAPRGRGRGQQGQQLMQPQQQQQQQAVRPGTAPWSGGRGRGVGRGVTGGDGHDETPRNI